MSTISFHLDRTRGFLVADALGRMVGRVECPLYGTSREQPDALAVKGGFLRQRRLVPVDAIDQVDEGSGVVGLRLSRDDLRRFL